MTADHLGRSFAWDQDDLLQSCTVAAGASVGEEGTHAYAHDALGRRVSKTVDQGDGTFVTTVFAQVTLPIPPLGRVGGQVLAEYAAGAAPAAPDLTYVYGSYVDEPLAIQDAAGDRLYCHRDGRYSVIALTDAAGAVAERYAYDAHGNRLVADAAGVLVSRAATARRGFTGLQADDETGLCYARARLYDPRLGRLLNRDPLRYLADANLYRWVGGRPMDHADPSGEFWHIVGGAVGGAVLGGILAAATGGDIGEAIFVGAVAGGVFAATLNPILASASVGAVSAVSGTAGVGIALAGSGAAAGAAGQVASDMYNGRPSDPNEVLESSLYGAVGGPLAGAAGAVVRPIIRPVGNFLGPQVNRCGRVAVDALGRCRDSLRARFCSPPKPNCNLRPGQVASAYPQGRRAGGRGHSTRPTDPPAGTRESGAWDLTPRNQRLMEAGRPPIGRDGRVVELHHRNQCPNGPLDEMTATTHDAVPHPFSPSRINRSQFAGERARYWRTRVRVLLGQDQ